MGAGRREAAAPFVDTPEIGVERARVSAETPDGRAREWACGSAQPIETGGQHSRRSEAAAATLDAVR
ncbi:MAG: hypothetical protein KJ043_04185, partial [Anaerolineae bacterium]|nr:hypothetical protein [Anaerolineae bacterium]